MCGVISLVSRIPVRDRIMAALKRLEYRGYDSAGIATLEPSGIEIFRSVGVVDKLSEKLPALEGTIGLGHTRWATHGKPTEQNAHPHANDVCAVVHNGVIDNYLSLRTELEADGVVFKSDTDTEVIVHAFQRIYERTQDLFGAMKELLSSLRGSFAFALIVKDLPGQLIVMKRGTNPLVLGQGSEHVSASSDMLGLVGIASTVHHMESGTWALLSLDGVSLFTEHGEEREPQFVPLIIEGRSTERGAYSHYMLKEIEEQPAILQRLIHKPDNEFSWDEDLSRPIVLTACGTSLYASMIGKHYFENIARLPITLELASEPGSYRPNTQEIILTVSQSGETADTLRAANEAKAMGKDVMTIVNAGHSALSRLASRTFLMHAGPEIGVAATKSFSSQVFVLLQLAMSCARRQGREMPFTEDALHSTVVAMNRVLEQRDQIVGIANAFSTAQHMLYLGRGIAYPLALEGALKMKEISYCHAEGFAAGELKHGSIALVEEDTPIIVLAPSGPAFERTASNLQEVSARGGKIVVITDERGAQNIRADALFDMMVLPEVHPYLCPFIFMLPLQLLAYHVALSKGLEIDQPRNLAKCVTVD